MDMSTDPQTPRPPRRRPVTRARILDAAMEVIGRKGFQRASLDEIAAQAGLTKGAIYSSFGSKDELFMAVVAEKGLKLAPQVEASMDAAAYFRALGDATARLLPQASAQAAFVAEFHLYALTHEDLRQKMQARYAEQFDAFARQAERHPDKTGAFTADQIPVVVQALSLGFMYQHFLTPDRVTPDLIVAAFEALGRPAPDNG